MLRDPELAGQVMGYHKIQQFLRMGLLLKELSTVRQGDFLVCQACQFGKRKRLYSKSSFGHNAISTNATHLGDYISVDLIHSPIGGLIPQNRGKPRTEHYNYACVFVAATQSRNIAWTMVPLTVKFLKKLS